MLRAPHRAPKRLLAKFAERIYVFLPRTYWVSAVSDETQKLKGVAVAEPGIWNSMIATSVGSQVSAVSHEPWPRGGTEAGTVFRPIVSTMAKKTLSSPFLP